MLDVRKQLCEAFMPQLLGDRFHFETCHNLAPPHRFPGLAFGVDYPVVKTMPASRHLRRAPHRFFDRREVQIIGVISCAGVIRNAQLNTNEPIPMRRDCNPRGLPFFRLNPNTVAEI